MLDTVVRIVVVGCPAAAAGAEETLAIGGELSGPGAIEGDAAGLVT